MFTLLPHVCHHVNLQNAGLDSEIFPNILYPLLFIANQVDCFLFDLAPAILIDVSPNS